MLCFLLFQIGQEGTDLVGLIAVPGFDDLQVLDRQVFGHWVAFNEFFELCIDRFDQGRLCRDAPADGNLYQIQDPIEIVDLFGNAQAKMIQSFFCGFIRRQTFK